jgi:hypothetical protein
LKDIDGRALGMSKEPNWDWIQIKNLNQRLLSRQARNLLSTPREDSLYLMQLLGAELRRWKKRARRESPAQGSGAMSVLYGMIVEPGERDIPYLEMEYSPEELYSLLTGAWLQAEDWYFSEEATLLRVRKEPDFGKKQGLILDMAQRNLHEKYDLEALASNKRPEKQAR